MQQPLKQGDVVRVRPQYLEPGDDSECCYVVVGDEGPAGSVQVTPVGTGLHIPPIHTWTARTLERTEA